MNLRADKLREAIGCLTRAASDSTGYPHGTAIPCKHRQAAARAEVAAAVALIKEAEYD